MWPHRSHVLASLTAHTGAPKKGIKAPPFIRTPDMQKAFDQMKTPLAADALGAYPNHNEPHHIYTDASNYHLVPVSCKTTYLSPITAKTE